MPKCRHYTHFLSRAPHPNALTVRLFSSVSCFLSPSGAHYAALTFPQSVSQMEKIASIRIGCQLAILFTVLMKWTQPSSHTSLTRGKMGVVESATHTHRQEERRAMMPITTLGIDVAKHVFQLHGVDARGRAVLSRRVKRSQLLDAVASLPPCVIGREACGSAHHWGRAFEQLGHTVKLMHPKYVKTNKNDGRDAEAICEAVSRPTMRFVLIKTVEQADMQAVHRTRSLFVKHRTAVMNQIRGLLAE